ncbi:MAG TPA: (d)CMP kinase, partial [Gemmatales bacterium]|nr:(d)CMP kinase [Gemmatales bacterium]
MIVTIDGPSASGKTSVARELAQRLEFALLRTGAMYRALALAAHRHHWVSRHAEAELLAQLSHWHIDADETHVYLNGEDVSKEIEGQAMSQLSSLWAEVREVREHITGFIRQRAISYLAEGRSFIAEGRDQGSYVFPEAQCKFYIDADVTIRAARRLHDLQQRGENSLTISDMVKQLNLRDNRDRARHFAPL